MGIIIGMSQKVRILKVRRAGCSVFLGLTLMGIVWTRNPERIMDWLLRRVGREPVQMEIRAQRPNGGASWRTSSPGRIWVDVPLGGADVKPAVKDSQARLDCSLADVHSLAYPLPCRRVGNTGWFAGLKRKRTSGGQVPVGSVPARRLPQVFQCVGVTSRRPVTPCIIGRASVPVWSPSRAVCRDSIVAGG